jgi:hypothetical protein
MNTLALYALICLGDNCTAYTIDYNLSQSDCDQYFTDAGLEKAETLMLYYIPEYQQGQNVILSCGNE